MEPVIFEQGANVDCRVEKMESAMRASILLGALAFLLSTPSTSLAQFKPRCPDSCVKLPNGACSCWAESPEFENGRNAEDDSLTIYKADEAAKVWTAPFSKNESYNVTPLERQTLVP